MNRFTLFITLLLASIGIGWAQSSPSYVTTVQTSTPDNPRYYTIENYRAATGGTTPSYLASQTDLGNALHIATKTSMTLWIAEEATTDATLADGVQAVYLYNPASQAYLCHGTSGDNPPVMGTAEDKNIWYLVRNPNAVEGYTSGFGISTVNPTSVSDNGATVNIDNNNAFIDSHAGNTGLGKWNSSNTRNNGNTWFFAEASIESNAASLAINPLSQVDGLWSQEALQTYQSTTSELITNAKTFTDLDNIISPAENAFSTLFASLNGAYRSFYQLNTENAGRGDRSLSSYKANSTELTDPLTSAADCGTIFTIEIVDGGTTFKLKTFDGKYVGPMPTQNYTGITTVDNASSAGIFGITPWMSGVTLKGIGIYDVANPSNYLHNSGNRNIVKWNAPSGDNNASGWLVADESANMANIAMLTDYSNQFAAMNAFPDGTFNTEGISIPEITAATPIADITSAAATVPAAMVNVAASADGKVVVFKNGSKYIADAEGNTNLGTATSLTPGAGWILQSQENQSNFYLKNVLTGRYIGKNNTATERATVPMAETTSDAANITFDFNTGILISTNEVYQHQSYGAHSYLYNSDNNITIWGRGHGNSQWTAEAVTVPTAVTVAPEALTLTIGETPANNTLTAALTGENITAGFDALEWTAGEGLTLAEVTDQPSKRTVTLANNAAAGTAKVTVASTLKGLNLAPAEATVTINAASPLLPLVSTEGNEHYYAIKAIRNTSQNGNNNPEDLSGSYIRPTISETALIRQNAIDDYAVMIFETAEGVEIPAGFSMAVKIKNIKTGKYFGGTIKYNQLNLTDAAGATTWYLTTGNASANGTDYEGVMMANLALSGNNYLDAGGYANLDYWQPNTMGSLWIMEPETIPSGVTIALGEQELLTSTEAQTVTVTPTWTPDNLNDAFKTLTYAVTTDEGDNKAEAEGFTVTGGNLTVPANAAAGTYTVTATTFNHIEATATLTINDRVLQISSIRFYKKGSQGLDDNQTKNIVTLGTQTAADTWTAKDVTLSFRVKVTDTSKAPEASDFTVASDNAALAVAENGVAVSGPDDTEYYTVTVSATAVAPAELVKLSVNTLQVPLQIAKPAVSIKSITVSATGLTDGEITIGQMTDATADGVTYAPSADMTVTAAIELDEVSSWPTAADIAASVDAENAAGIAPSTFTPVVTRNDDGTFTAAIGTVTASKVGTSTITVIQEVTEGEGKYATLNITGVAPVVSVDEVTAPEAATVTLTKDAEGTIGASAEQTAVFNVFTDHPTTMVEVPAVASSEGIEIIGTPVVALTTTEGGTATFGVSFTATVNYRAKADASAAETLTVSYGEVSATLDITVVTPVTGISAEAAASTIILGENGEATTTISGEISPEAAGFTADQITAEVNASEGLTVAGALKGEGNSFTMDVTATKAGYYTVTVSYVKGEETIAAAPIGLYVSNPAPENGITVSAPATMPEDVDIEVSEAEAGEPQTVSIAFNSPAETHQIVLPVEQQFVNIHTLYDVVYADNNAEGASIEAYLLANNDGTASVILTNKEGAEVPFNTVIKVVEKNATSRAAGNTVIVINASINAAKIESVSINGGRSIEVYLNQTLTLTAETEPASDNEVTYVVTDSKGNVVEPTAPGQYVFTVEGTYTVTATVTGTVPAVTATAVIRVLNATGNPGEGVSGIEAVNADAANGKATIYDLAGRRLTRINAAGIYIVNGVKTLVR